MNIRVPSDSAETLQRILRWLPVSGLIYFLFALLGLYKFADIAQDVALRDDITFYDVVVVNLLNAFATPLATSAFLGLTHLGGYFGLSTLYFISMGYFLWMRRWQPALLLTLSTGGGWLLVDLAKGLFARERPITNTPLLQEIGFSFPSGHSGISLCFYGVFLYLILHARQPWSIKLLLMSLLAGLVGLIGLSRVYLGVHYPSDVLGGFSLGLFWLSLCLALYEGGARYRAKSRHRKGEASWNPESA